MFILIWLHDSGFMSSIAVINVLMKIVESFDAIPGYTFKCWKKNYKILKIKTWQSSLPRIKIYKAAKCTKITKSNYISRICEQKSAELILKYNWFVRKKIIKKISHRNLV